MITEIMTITPELATEMLAQNVRNRRLDMGRAKAYAELMSAGKWTLTHQGIAFDESGALIDGQTRLRAIVIANTPVQMMVTRGMPTDHNELFHIDIGRARSAANIAELNGEGDMVKTMLPVAHLLMRFSGVDVRRITPERKIEMIKANNIPFEILYEAGERKKQGMHAVVLVGLFAALINGASAESVSAFIRVWRKNEVRGMDEYNTKAVLTLKQSMKGSSISPTQENLKTIEGVIHTFMMNTRSVVKKIWYPLDKRLVIPQ